MTRSGADAVLLSGNAMVPLVRAVAALGSAGIGRYAVVGGVAVAARLGHAHRATADIDAVVDATEPPEAVETLLALPGSAPDPTDDQRVLLDGAKVEILAVGPTEDDELEGIPPKDALFVAAHSWALDTATLLTVAATKGDVEATASFATPPALVAMKLHAIEARRPARGLDKRAGDAWDIYRLLADLDADGALGEALANAPAPLRSLVRDAAERVLVTSAVRTRGWLRSGDVAMAAVAVDELRFLGRRLVAALT